MVSVRAHGGNCCGAYHISGFGDDEERNPDLIDAAVAQCPAGRQLEAILNGTQVRSRPRTLQRLADLGFVLVGHTRNSNHDSHIYTFHRDDRREPLLEGPLANRWNGMVITPGLNGTLPGVLAAPRPDNTIRPGRRVRVNSLASVRHGNIYEVARVGRDAMVYMRDHERDNIEFGIITHNCVLQPLDAAPGVPRAVMVHRDGPGNEQVRLQPAQAPDIVVVHSLFANSYRRTGRSIHRYTSAAGAIARRAGDDHGVRLDRCDLLSDGNERWYTDCNNDGTGGILEVA